MPAAPIQQASHCFGFEHDFIGSWRCIPLCVRRKLDLIGLKLRLSHWLALTQTQRQELVDWSDDPGGLTSLAAHLRACTRALADGEAQPLPPATAEPWQNATAIPEGLGDAARQRGISLSLKQWGELSELERFALCKLARPGHDHHNLNAAFSEVLG